MINRPFAYSRFDKKKYMFFSLSFFKGDTEGKTFPVPWKSNGNDKELK